MKIIVTGGRDFKDAAVVGRILSALSPDIVVVGDCPTGADFLAPPMPIRPYAARCEQCGCRIHRGHHYGAFEACRRIGALREAIESDEAPHGRHCKALAAFQPASACDCWKSRALAPREDERCSRDS